MLPTVPSAAGLSFLSLIDDKEDYPQKQIIFKFSRIGCFCIQSAFGN
jgi:hypothetical protein